MNPVVESLLAEQCGPSPALLARNTLLSASGLRMGLMNLLTDVRALVMTCEGDLLVVPAHDAPERVAGFGGGFAMSKVHLTAHDLAPVPMADRIRGSLFMVAEISERPERISEEAARHLFGAGELPEGELVLRLRPRRIQVTRRVAGAGESVYEVDLAEYRATMPDPLLAGEEQWLRHLDRDHADVLEAVAARLAGAPWRGPVRPVALDSYGMTLRVSAPERDLRLTFDAPVRCGCEMAEAFGALLDRLLPEGPWLECGE